MIAVIAILAAVLFPVFQEVRKNERHASCQCRMPMRSSGVYQYPDDPTAGCHGPPLLALSQQDAPAKTALLLEVSENAAAPAQSHENVDHAYSPKTGRHSAGTNCAFCDGHVRWLRGSSLSSVGSVYNAAGTSDPAFLGTLSPT